MRGTYYEFLGQKLTLLPEKCLWWEDQKMLIAADMHWGKSAHFRKSGLFVPKGTQENDKNILIRLLEEWQPTTFVCLGDMFHSQQNQDVLDFKEITQHFPKTTFVLVKGNHDILPTDLYVSLGIQLKHPIWKIEPFCFIHDVAEKEKVPEGLYPLGGHVHPIIELKGKGAWKERRPCFYFGKTFGLLPAFGGFKGGAAISPQEDEKCFVVGNGNIHIL